MKHKNKRGFRSSLPFVVGATDFGDATVGGQYQNRSHVRLECTVQKAEALKQIQVLESRASEYRQALDSLTSTIDGLKKENGLLEPAEDASK